MFVVLIVLMFIGMVAVEVIELREKCKQFGTATREKAHQNHQRAS